MNLAKPLPKGMKGRQRTLALPKMGNRTPMGVGLQPKVVYGPKDWADNFSFQKMQTLAGDEIQLGEGYELGSWLSAALNLKKLNMAAGLLALKKIQPLKIAAATLSKATAAGGASALAKKVADKTGINKALESVNPKLVISDPFFKAAGNVSSVFGPGIDATINQGIDKVADVTAFAASVLPGTSTAVNAAQQINQATQTFDSGSEGFNSATTPPYPTTAPTIDTGLIGPSDEEIDKAKKDLTGLFVITGIGTAILAAAFIAKNKKKKKKK
ncbi:hypothetical protein AB3N61_09320 [Leptospira sp. WS58.C1]|uniref:hypothetical protein n=1 Tax=Leptospira cinconiae TaxID=3235173 RepID=UPI00349EBA25